MKSRITLALVALLAPAALSAQTPAELQKQIEQLKLQLKAIEEKAKEKEAAAPVAEAAPAAATEAAAPAAPAAPAAV